MNSLKPLLIALQAQLTPSTTSSNLNVCWQAITSPQIQQNTRVLQMSRQVLWVATSSSAWAQTLTLQRLKYLKQLNQHLPEPLIDIRFSPAKWHGTPHLPLERSLSVHPSQLTPVDTDLLAQSATHSLTPQQALRRWTQLMGDRLNHLPNCPNCQCPTPPGELDRWQTCAYCAAQKWQSPTSEISPH